MSFRFALTLVALLECVQSVRAHVAPSQLIFILNDENILSACPDFGLAVEIDIASANSDFRSVCDLMWEHSTTFTSPVSSIPALAFGFNFCRRTAILFPFSRFLD
jgi:hypothetical protein